MPNFTITAPASITVRGVEGTSTITVNAPAVVPPVVIPPVIIPPTPPTPSPAWTEITAPGGGQLVTDDHKIVTIKAGAAQIGGAPMGHSTFVTKMLKDAKGTIWQESRDPAIAGGVGYWPWPTGATAWGAQAADPRPGAVIPPVIIPPVIIPPVTTGTPRANLLAFLGTVAAQGKMITAQMSFPNQKEFDADTVANGGRPIGMMCNDAWLFESDGSYDTSFVARQIAHWKAGGLIQASMLLPNPGNTGTTRGSCDLGQCIRPGTALNNTLNGMLDKVARDVYLPYKAQGIPCIIRMLWEFDLGAFWWDSGNNGAAAYKALWIYIHDYLVVTKGCDNLVWVWACNGGPEPNSVITASYPGDAYADISGVDCYTDSPQNQYPGILSVCRQVAPTKLQAFTEFGFGDAGTPGKGRDAYTLVNGFKNRTWGSQMLYVMCWSGWNWSDMANLQAALNDPAVLNLGNMNRGF